METHKRAENPSLQFTSDYDLASIWKLPFIFERLVFRPNPDRLDKNSSINKIVSRRLQLFQSGQLSLLYKESNDITSKTRKQYSEDPVKIQQSAQLAADLDNRKLAYAQICQHMPVANISDSNIDVLHDLHPPSLKLIMDEPRETRQSTRLQQQSRRKFSLAPDDMLPILSSLRRGKAPGPELNSPDIFIKLAGLHERSKNKNKQCKIQTKTLALFFTIMANGNMPTCIVKIIRTTYLVALHKDPDNNKKLRPLGIPSAIQQITAACI